MSEDLNYRRLGSYRGKIKKYEVIYELLESHGCIEKGSFDVFRFCAKFMIGTHRCRMKCFSKKLLSKSIAAQTTCTVIKLNEMHL